MVAGAAVLIAAIGISRLCIVGVELARRWQGRNLTLHPTS
jgi:hypothetical protein